MAVEIIDKTITFFTEVYSKLIIKIVVSLIILLIGFIVGKIVGRLVYKILNELKINAFFQKTTGLKVNPDDIISKGVTYLIDFFVIIIAFDAIAFTPTLLYIFSGALVVIIVFTVIIGIKDIIPNVVAGMIIYRKGVILKDNEIEINGHKGRVDKVSLLETTIIKKNGDLLYLPNSAVLKFSILKKNIKEKNNKE